MEVTVMEEMRSLEDLLDLQAVDIEIDRLLHRRATLPQLEEYRAAHEEVAALEERISEVSGRLREADLASDKADGELQLAEQKLQREEQRLFAGGLSARDAEHLRREVEMLRRQTSEREDEILVLMEQRDEAQSELDGLRSEHSEAKANEERLSAAISEVWKGIDAEIAAKESRKAAIVPLIDADLLELYEELRPAKEGVAVGRLAEGVCGGCHLRLSAAEQAQVTREHPPRCLHCRRILVPQ
jgi:predicted  nucleic acid-binding Zn-ribbon protein